jgi:hypothetical protein
VTGELPPRLNYLNALPFVSKIPAGSYLSPSANIQPHDPDSRVLGSIPPSPHNTHTHIRLQRTLFYPPLCSDDEQQRTSSLHSPLSPVPPPTAATRQY